MLKIAFLILDFNYKKYYILSACALLKLFSIYYVMLLSDFYLLEFFILSFYLPVLSLDYLKNCTLEVFCLKFFFQFTFIYVSDYFLLEEIASFMICFYADINLNLEFNWIRFLICICEIRLLLISRGLHLF